MRLNQLSLKITRYGEQVPKGYPEDRMIVNIYADSNNLYEALSKLQAKAVNVMEQWERVGARCDITERRDNINHPISEKLLVRRYDENRELEYTKSRLEMQKQLLGYIEKSTEILDIIKNSTKENLRNNLINKFNYTEMEVENILRINFGMLTADDVQEIKNDIEQLEKSRIKTQQRLDEMGN